MSRSDTVKPYKKECDYSYAQGAYCTIEMIRSKAQYARGVYVRSGCADRDRLKDMCGQFRIPLEENDRIFQRIGGDSTPYPFIVIRSFSNSSKLQ